MYYIWGREITGYRGVSSDHAEKLVELIIRGLNKNICMYIDFTGVESVSTLFLEVFFVNLFWYSRLDSNYILKNLVITWDNAKDKELASTIMDFVINKPQNLEHFKCTHEGETK